MCAGLLTRNCLLLLRFPPASSIVLPSPLPTVLARLPALSRPYHVAAAVLFAVAGGLLFGPYLRMLPEGSHVFAQTDRLALAINFYDYGFDFWHPRTSSLLSIGGITGVEFPLQSYAAALGGLVFGRGNIGAVFRALDAAAAVVGFWYLFRLVFERTGNFAAGLLPGAFLMTAPTYAFYAGSVLPDPFSFSVTLVGYYYWLRYFDAAGRFADLLVALALLTLAALIKTTSGLHLVAVSGITLLYALLQPERFAPRQRVQLLATLGAGAAITIGFFLHNTHLNSAYQSPQFLAATMPADGLDTWHAYVRIFTGTWRYEYLTPVQYRVLLVCGVVCVALAYRGWRRYPRLVLLLLSSLAISLLFYQLMGAQLAVHDYYAICSFLPPVVLVLVLALVLAVPLVPGRWPRLALSGALLVLAGYLVRSSFGQLAGRMGDDHLPMSQYYTHRWMRGGAALLEQAGVPPRARVLVLGDYSTNISLVYFDRRGRTMIPFTDATSVADIVQAMSADSLQYAIMQPFNYERLAQEQPALREAFEPVLEKPMVVVLRRRHPEQIAW